MGLFLGSLLSILYLPINVTLTSFQNFYITVLGIQEDFGPLLFHLHFKLCLLNSLTVVRVFY